MNAHILAHTSYALPACSLVVTSFGVKNNGNFPYLNEWIVSLNPL